jgi:predicted transcriptional regulator
MRRNNLDIYSEILNLSEYGAKKTQIVYRANLNFNIAKKHIDALMERGFVEKNARLYFTTERGKKFVENYRQIKSMVTER